MSIFSKIYIRLMNDDQALRKEFYRGCTANFFFLVLIACIPVVIDMMPTLSKSSYPHLRYVLFSKPIIWIAVFSGGVANFVFDVLTTAVSRIPSVTSEKGWRQNRVPSWWTGMRWLIAVAVAYVDNVSDVITLVGGWMALRLATNWQKSDETKGYERPKATRGLLFMAISMTFASIGGLLCRGLIVW